MAWQGHNLVLTDDGAKRVLRPYLSPSSASAINQCPARHAADRTLPRTEHPFGDAELGTAGHTVLEHLFDLPPKKRSKRNARKLLTRLWKEEVVKHTELADPKTKFHWLGAVWMRVRGEWAIENPKLVNVRSTEWALGDNHKTPSTTGVVLVNTVPFVGVIDRVDHDEDDNDLGDEVGNGVGEPPPTVIGDYKTGKPSTVNRNWTDSHGDQLRLYAAAVEAVDGVAPTAARVLYTRYGQARYVSLSPEDMKDTLARFRQAWEDLQKFVEANLFPARPSGLCPWCPLVASCPAAKDAGRDEPAAKDGTVIYLPIAQQMKNSPKPVIKFAPKHPGEGSIDVGVPDGFDETEIFNAEADTRYDNETVGASAMPPTVGTSKASPEGKRNLMLKEDKPWLATVDGALNPTSYSATAVFGTVSMAVKALHEEGQSISGPNVMALAGTFASIVERVQTEFTGTSSPQEGMNTRLRGALHTALETLPIPFGGTTAEWEKWDSRVTQRVKAIANAAVKLFDDGPQAKAWAVLAVDPEPEGEEDWAAGFDDDE